MSVYAHPMPATRRTPNDPRVWLGPLSVDSMPREQLIESILQDALKGTSLQQVATVNAQFYVLAEHDRAFRDCLNRAQYVCADGFSIAAASKLLANRSLQRLAGVDLVEELCRRGAPEGLRVFFLGGRAGSASRAAEILKERYPGLTVAGISCPPFHFEKDKDCLQGVLEQIRLARPQVVFVALGAPKQEFFIDQYLRTLEIPVAVGVGGSFEILIGVTHRAPQFMQQMGMEWFYRLMQEPRRLWRRYLLGNPEFLLIVARYAFGRAQREMAGKIPERIPEIGLSPE